MSEYIKLDIGSGRAKMSGYKTVDCDPIVGADICADIEVEAKRDRIGGLESRFGQGAAFEGMYERVSEIRAHHILEHLSPENKVISMAFFYDLLEPGGILDIEVPLFPHSASVQDPTHISFWTKESFWYFTKDNRFGEAFAKRFSNPKVPLFEFVEDWKRGDENNPWAYGIKLRKPKK